jgi:uncharacterized protein (DUF1697 family)
MNRTAALESARMRTYIALFRGINVGGNHMLPMKDLKRLLEKQDCVDVRTYIQSGNAVFRTDAADVRRFSTRITAAISKSHGFEPRVLLLTRKELEAAAAANPFPEAGENPKNVHLFFLSESPAKPNLDGCRTLQTKTERFALTKAVFYIHTPDGFGTSKLAGRVEQMLGVKATARNWRTVTTLLEMAQAAGE